MDLIELRRAVRRWWRHGLAVLVVVLVAGVVIVGPADRRVAGSTTLLVTPRAERFEIVSTGVLRVVLPNVLVVARSRDLREEVAPTLGDLADVPIQTEARFVPDSGVLTLTARSASPAAAVAWSVALADALADRFEEDPYLIVEVLDRATGAARPKPGERLADLLGIAVLALFASIFTVFALQRARESGDLAGRVRAGGIPVLAELAVPGRSSRHDFRGDHQAGRLASSLVAARGVRERDRFVIVSDETRAAMAVVDATRAGLRQIGMQRSHKVALGPEIADLPAVHMEAYGDGRCVVVLDPTFSVDRFVDDVHVLLDAGVPVVGVVIVRRRPFGRATAREDTENRRNRSRQVRGKASAR